MKGKMLIENKKTLFVHLNFRQMDLEKLNNVFPPRRDCHYTLLAFLHFFPLMTSLEKV